MNYSYPLDFEPKTKELTLLIEILKNKNEDIICLISKELFVDIDWDKFIQLAIHHRVYPIIYVRLKSIKNKWIPPYVIRTLYEEYKKNTLQMLKLSGEMEQVSELFTENGIRLLFLKGPVIAAELYGDISQRTSGDLDILIPINDLKRAEELLLNIGYERMEATTPFWKVRYHHITYFHVQKRIHIEIHWRLHPQSLKEPKFNELWKRRRISNLTNYPVYFFGEEDLFLYLVAHGARHGWFRLRWLTDINQIISMKMIINENVLLTKKFKSHHLGGDRHFLGQTLILVSQLFNTPINEAMQTITEKNRSIKLAKITSMYIKERAQLNFTMSEDDLAKYHNRYLFKIKSRQQRVIFIMKLFYPNPKDAETLRLPKPLMFLYLPLRPFLWAWRKTRTPK
ncbi:nucleotidyltransferase domain-containing protein [Peribacillus butanolivorans]